MPLPSLGPNPAALLWIDRPSLEDRVRHAGRVLTLHKDESARIRINSIVSAQVASFALASPTPTQETECRPRGGDVDCLPLCAGDGSGCHEP